MVQLDELAFEQIVTEAIEAIPEEFRQKLDNLSFHIQDQPTPEQRQKLNLRQGSTLFGLYEGVPLLARGSNYFAVLPDRITIFKQPIEYFARDEQHLKEIVQNTIWHEVAHHFGMDEAQVRNAEKNRGHKY